MASAVAWFFLAPALARPAGGEEGGGDEGYEGYCVFLGAFHCYGVLVGANVGIFRTRFASCREMPLLRGRMVVADGADGNVSFQLRGRPELVNRLRKCKSPGIMARRLNFSTFLIL